MTDIYKLAAMRIAEPYTVKIIPQDKMRRDRDNHKNGRARSKRYRDSHLEQRRKNSRDWDRAHPEKRRERWRRWNERRKARLAEAANG